MSSFIHQHEVLVPSRKQTRAGAQLSPVLFAVYNLELREYTVSSVGGSLNSDDDGFGRASTFPLLWQKGPHEALPTQVGWG